MSFPNHYQILGISPRATQAEIKLAYRRLVKRFHPDNHPQSESHHDAIVTINLAYEVLGDPQHRQRYDRQLQKAAFRGSVTTRSRPSASSPPVAPHPRAIDEHLEAWLRWVYTPVSKWIVAILEPLSDQIDHLADDPFDEQLMAEFQAYLEASRQSLTQAHQCFCSMPNPANLAGVAASLYYCLHQLGDGIEQLEFFTQNYDDYYLHTGQELFRIARGLRWEAEVVMNRS
jgi:molecular chaperone DnaJ